MVILGMSWLACHNPEIDWRTGEVKMTRYPEEYETTLVETKARQIGVAKKKEKEKRKEAREEARRERGKKERKEKT